MSGWLARMRPHLGASEYTSANLVQEVCIAVWVAASSTVGAWPAEIAVTPEHRLEGGPAAAISVPHGHTICRGEFFTLDVQVFAGSAYTRYFNPFFGVRPPRPAMLAVFREDGTFLGSPFDRDVGSRPTTEDSDWILMRPGQYAGTSLLAKLDRLPIQSTKPLTPGRYYLQMVFNERLLAQPLALPAKSQNRFQAEQDWMNTYRKPDVFRSNVLLIDLIEKGDTLTSAPTAFNCQPGPTDFRAVADHRLANGPRAVISLPQGSSVRLDERWQVDVRFYGGGPQFQFYNPFLNRDIPLPASLGLFDADGSYIGDLLGATEPQRIVAPSDWVIVSGGVNYVGSVFRVGLENLTASDKHPLKPGRYYLQMIYHHRIRSRCPVTDRQPEVTPESHQEWLDTWQQPDMFRSNPLQVFIREQTQSTSVDSSAG